MGAPDLLANLAAIGVTVTAQGGNLIVQPWSRVPDDLRHALRMAKPALLGLLAPHRRPYRLMLVESREAHRDPWDDATIARFQARMSRLLRLGFGEQDAEDLAEALHFRDVRADDRHLCLECRHYRLGRCGNHRPAGLRSPEVGRDLPTKFQHCAGFAPAEGVT
jgi:hypothetical protein